MGRAYGLLGFGDRLAEAAFALQQGVIQAVAQAHKGNIGKHDAGILGVQGFAGRVVAVDDMRIGRGVVKLRVRFVVGGYQHMAEAVLRAAIQRQGVTGIKAHGFAAAGNGDVQRSLRVGGQCPDPFGNAIGHGLVIGLRADVGQRLAIGLLQDVDVAFGKLRQGQVVVMVKARQPAVVDQG